jgi:hypothetical protein
VRPSLLHLIIGFALVGCSSNEIGPNDAAAGAGGAPVCASGPGFAESVEPRQIDSVSALLVDLDGAPIGNEVVQVCGTDVCIQGRTSANGGVTIAAKSPIRKAAFKFGEGKLSARFAWLLPEATEVDLGTVRSVRLPELDTAVPIVAGEVASSGGLTLEPPAGSRVRFDQLTFQTGNERGLRALKVPLDLAPSVVSEGPDLEIVYAATPNGTEFCPPAKLSIINDEGWPAGSEVEVWLHGIEIEEEWAPYGGWAHVADARVSEDGARIETLEGIFFFGVLGFKRK